MNPVFSIVTPTYNRPDRLKKYLESLTRLDYPRDAFEVILVDDESQLPLEPVTGPFRDRLNIVFLRQPHGGVAKGRQAGTEVARGAFLAFTDDDCEPAPGWLRNLERALRATLNCAAGGRTVNGLPRNPYSTASQTLNSFVYQCFNADPAHAQFLVGNNSAFPTALYREIGGLDVSWPFCGEDCDLCARWLDRGYPMVYAPDAIVSHSHDLTFRKFWRQHYNYGRGGCRLVRLCTARGGTGGTPVRHFNRAMLRFARSEFRGAYAFLIMALLLLSQLANKTGFSRERFWPCDRRPAQRVRAQAAR